MKTASIAILVALLAACSTPEQPPAPPPPAPKPAEAPPPPPPPPPAAPAPVTPPETSQQRFEHDLGALGNKSVYFAFDKYAINPEDVPVIEAHAKLAQAYENDHLTLQGNCDERGSREYNLALGQRRADAVKQRLVLLGVPASRVETVSFGKEKPRLTCHAEKCWKENRRTDFVDEWK